MTTGIVHDQDLEKQIKKQIGCMTGFFQIFDRQHILTGKRLNATKRILPPPPPVVDSSPEPEKTSVIPAVFRNPPQIKAVATPNPEIYRGFAAKEHRSPAREALKPAENQAKSPLPLPIFQSKEGTRSSWKFSKDAPRLSLDSRASLDGKGGLRPREMRKDTAILTANRCQNSGVDPAADGDENRRSTSVIARLMGLEPLPQSNPEPAKAELRRSASESRVSRDLFQNRLIDGNNFQLKQPNHSHFREDHSSRASSNPRQTDPTAYSTPKSEQPKRGVIESPWKTHQQRKSFFDAEDSFVEPKHNISVYGEIEKRLKMRGIDEPSTDLETLKQILEALQLKGLLHSKKPLDRNSHRNFVADGNVSQIVVMKPSRSPVSPFNRRFVNDFPPEDSRIRTGGRRSDSNAGQYSPAVSPRRERPENGRRNSTSPTRRESNTKTPTTPVVRRPLNVETQRKANEFREQRRASPVSSPKASPRRIVSDQTVISRSPRNRKSTVEIGSKNTNVMDEESSSVSESSFSTCSPTDTERSKIEEYKEGRSLLERCDKLLNSIAEMTSTNSQQPSPVSVLDSSFYKEEASSPPPIVMKRCISFKDQSVVSDEEIWPIQSKCEAKSEDADFVYISEILRVSNYVAEDTDIFLLLEKQRVHKQYDTVSRQRRRLVFDVIMEILERNNQIPPRKVTSFSKPSRHQIWSEFQKIREIDESEDLLETVCGVLRKDLAGDAITGWGEFAAETSESVLDIERLIFKDLVAETIGDLAEFGGSWMFAAPRRKLLF